MSSLFDKKILIVAVSCLLIGKYVLSSKPKVVTKEVVKIVEVEKKQTKKKKITTSTTNTDGSSTTQVTETEDSSSVTTTEVASNSFTTSKSGLTLGLLAIKSDFNLYKPVEYGATVSFPIFANLNVMGLVTTSKQVGVGLSLDF